jgi:hypothetical protein
LKRIVFTFTALIVCSHLAFGQAKPTATRTGDLQIGGAFIADFPDYTRHKFYGYGFYADLDFSEHWGVEGVYRQAHDTTQRIGGGGNVPQFQRNIEGGIRYHRTYNRLMPYAKIMYGYGVMQYPPDPPPASQATSIGQAGYDFVAAGGGIDYRFSPHITLRAELEYQDWFKLADPRLGFDYYAGTGGIPNGLSPIVYTGGIAWRFGSGQYVPHGDRRGIH